MKIQLSPTEARVLGVLVEKEKTTPDAYPMSINGITTGCNQKSSRDPVMELTEGEVQEALDSLVKATLAKPQGAAGGRVQRYAHRLGMRLFGEYEFSPAEQAVLCVLLLRGPQTPGELRTRGARLHDFEDLGQVERVLAGLAAREDGPHVAELAREPGRRENRWMHLFCGAPDAHGMAAAPPPPAAAAAGGESAPATGAPATTGAGDIARLEARVARLEAGMAELRRELGLDEQDAD